MGIVCQKCRDTFPDNEEVVCMGCNASLVSDSCFHEGRYEKVSALTKARDAALARVAELEAQKEMRVKACDHAATRELCSFGEDAPGKSLDIISQCKTCGATIHDYRHGGGQTSPNYPMVHDSPLLVPFKQIAQQLIASEARADRAEAALALVAQWTHEHGANLVPRRVDTYGEGMRDAKEQVGDIITAALAKVPA